MVECMSDEIGDEKTWAAFLKKFAGGDSVSKLVSQRAEEFQFSHPWILRGLVQAGEGLQSKI